jgi:hypothetical protein
MFWAEGYGFDAGRRSFHDEKEAILGSIGAMDLGDHCVVNASPKTDLVRQWKLVPRVIQAVFESPSLRSPTAC